ncbi:uncharacterized protein LOC121737136 [Aricia agestis]|uniref:uncharacterized protein LOC121737136 n=1 Tax=Aricia agestis TaxID=91739 RepID=UPI001C20AE0B|nr:uncharacterized protein LOC121737136 [Aricia agestis]
MKMALLLLMSLVAVSSGLKTHREMALINVTRFAAGDFFSLGGTECGVTRCVEVSHGTALGTLGAGCACQCDHDTPSFREDQRNCVNKIVECPMAKFGRGSDRPQIPFVYLPLKGQIIYPSKEIIFTDVEDAICAVTSAQYLSPSGWVTLRDLVDNDVPFGLYRDEGSTYLQWRGSSALHSRLEGRLVAVHVLCSAPKAAYIATSCAAFRIAGSSRNDVRSIPFHAGETVTTEPATRSQGLSVLESLAIGVCVVMLVFVYAAGIILYVHYKRRQKRNFKDPESNLSNTMSTENNSSFDSRMNIGSMRVKNNPLLNMDARNDFDAGLSDVSEQTEDTIDSSKMSHKFQNPNANIVAAMVHTRRKRQERIRICSTPDRLTERLQRRSSSPEIEKAPHSDVSILDCSLYEKAIESIPPTPTGEPRRKLYFNPVFFEIENLKNPPPAAIEFLMKLREVMMIAKEKMNSKRFVPVLSDIPEEELYHSIDLGWDLSCVRHARRFSVISLKRENSRRAVHCGGCPGCDSSAKSPKPNGLARSNSCKTCVSDEYKQKIVQKWLDEVPISNSKKPVKSVAKVSGTPRVTESKDKQESKIISIDPITREDDLMVAESIIQEYCNETRTKEINIEEDGKNMSNDKIIMQTKDDNKVMEHDVLNSKDRKPLNHATRVVRKRMPPPPQTPPPPPPPITNNLSLSTSTEDLESEPVSLEVKQKMEAVIQELNQCKRTDGEEFYVNNNITTSLTTPKLIISVAGSEPHSLNDVFNYRHRNTLYENQEMFDSLEKSHIKTRRFSLGYSPDLYNRDDCDNHISNIKISRERFMRSWQDIKGLSDNLIYNQHYHHHHHHSSYQHLSTKSNENLSYSNDYYSNSSEALFVEKPGSLTIKVTGSPQCTRQSDVEDFDPDTLDRKPKRCTTSCEQKRSIEKILLKSGGSFKQKFNNNQNNNNNQNYNCSPPKEAFTRKIGSLRQIYEARNKLQENNKEFRLFNERRASVPNGSPELATYINKLDDSYKLDDPKPPLPPKQKRNGETPRSSPNNDRVRTSEERDRFSAYSRSETSTRRSGRRSNRNRPRRTDMKRLCRTEDSGYLSTDSNDSKRQTRYMFQVKPKFVPQLEPVPKQLPPLLIESDTDDFESLCDGVSESGGESVETDSVFFGNFDDSKKLLEELRIEEYSDKVNGLVARDIILSGDSDSEHRSVISIVAGRDGRASSASITNLDDSPYVQSVEC